MSIEGESCAGLVANPEFTLAATQEMTVCEVLDRVLKKGAVLDGEMAISVSGIDLIYLGLKLILTSIETARLSGGCRNAASDAPIHCRGGLMACAEPTRLESEPMNEFARVMQAGPELCLEKQNGRRLDLDSSAKKNGLAQLVLTLIKLLHEVLERQAIRRVESGSLREEQIEKLGLALMQQSQEIERLRQEFGLEEEDLNLDLGPLGRLL